MATWNRVYAQIWSNPEFRSWTEDGRHAALYVLTCDQRSTEGLFRLPLVFAAYELQWPQGRVDDAFAELESSGFVVLDRDVDLVWIVNALRWEQPKGDKRLKGAVAALLKTPKSSIRADYLENARIECPELADALDSAGFIPHRRGIEGVSKGYRPHSHSQSQPHSQSHTPTTPSVTPKGDDPKNGGGGSSYPHPPGPMEIPEAVWHSTMDRLGYVDLRDPGAGHLRTIELALDNGHQPDALVALADDAQADEVGDPLRWVIGAWRRLGQRDHRQPPRSVEPAVTQSENSRPPSVPDFEPDDAPIDFDAAPKGLAAARGALDR